MCKINFVFDVLDPIKHMDYWIKFLVDVLLLMKYPTGAFKLCPLMVTGLMPLHLGGIFKGGFTTAVLCCCSQFLV